MSKITVPMAVGFVFLALLGFSEKANAQVIYYEWAPPVYYPPGYYVPPPVYYPYPYGVPYGVWDYRQIIPGRVPLDRRLDIDPRFPGPWGYNPPPPNISIYDREGPDEKEGEKEIRSHLLSKKIKFRMNMPITFSTDRGIFTLKSDFQLRNGVIIEYWSQWDKQRSDSLHNEFERFKQTFIPEPNNIPKPYFLLDKKDVYEECRKTGKKIYFIDPVELRKDPNQPVSIEQALDEILKEIGLQVVERQSKSSEVSKREP